MFGMKSTAQKRAEAERKGISKRLEALGRSKMGEKIAELSAISRACGITIPELSGTNTPEKVIESFTISELQDALYFLQDRESYILTKELQSWKEQLKGYDKVSQNSGLLGRMDAFLTGRREFNQLLYEFSQPPYSGIDLRDTPELNGNIQNLSIEDLDKLSSFLREKRQTNKEGRGVLYSNIYQRLRTLTAEQDSEIIQQRSEQEALYAELYNLQKYCRVDVRPMPQVSTQQRIDELSQEQCEEALLYLQDKPNYIATSKIQSLINVRSEVKSGHSASYKLVDLLESSLEFLRSREDTAALLSKLEKDYHLDFSFDLEKLENKDSEELDKLRDVR